MRQCFLTITLLVFCAPSIAQPPGKAESVDAHAHTLSEVIQGLDAALQLLQRERVGLLRAYELSVRHARDAGLSLAPQRGQAPEWLGSALQQPAPSGMLELGALDWGTLERLRTLSGGALPEDAKRVPGLVADVEDALTRTEAKWTGVVQWQQKLRELAQGKPQLQLRKPEQKDYDKWNGVLEVEAQAGTALDAWLLGRLGHRVELRASGEAGLVSARLVAEVRYRQGLIVVERRGDEVVGLSPLVFLVGVEDSVSIEELYGGRKEEPAARAPDGATPTQVSPPARMLEAEKVHYEGFTPDDSKGWVEEKREGQRTRRHPKRIVHDATGIALVYIPAGEFLMGSPEGERGRNSDERQHRRVIRRAFYLGETEVTQAQWVKVMGSNPVELWEGINNRSTSLVRDQLGPDNPIPCVSWNDCQQFTQSAGAELRLPSEAEWEYACRAGTTTAYWWGDDPAHGVGKGNFGRHRDWSFDDGFQHVAPVRTFAANPWGLYDMLGSVWEFCGDDFGTYPASGTEALANGGEGQPVVRGGSWGNGPDYCRAATRGRGDPIRRAIRFGCRVARSTTP